MKVVWSALAEKRTAEAYAYIANDRPSATARWLDRLLASVAMLAKIPDRGRAVPELEGPEIRQIIVAPYRAFICAAGRKCGARVDALGIITSANNRRLDPKFSFTLEGVVDGITASRSNGTEWITLMWGCGQAPCLARMTELGVETLPPIR